MKKETAAAEKQRADQLAGKVPACATIAATLRLKSRRPPWGSSSPTSSLFSGCARALPIPDSRTVCSGSPTTSRTAGEVTGRPSQISTLPYGEYSEIFASGYGGADRDFQFLLVWSGDSRWAARMDVPRPVGVTAVKHAISILPTLLIARVFVVPGPCLWVQNGAAHKTDRLQRTFPQSKVVVQEALKEMRPSLSGHLPVLDGFANSGDAAAGPLPARVFSDHCPL